MRYTAILFDLDGTLTDPYEGIARSLIYALERLGAPIPAAEAIRGWIGPPLHETFTRYLGDRALADRAIALYRERYEPIGAFENYVYPGIPELLGELQAAGYPLAVATSKLESAAVNILTHFGLAPAFRVVVGASRDSTLSAKSDIIARALALLDEPARRHPIMVGDRAYDVIGARTNAIPCIGVSYGYGDAAELQGAGATYVADAVLGLRKILLGEARPSTGSGHALAG